MVSSIDRSRRILTHLAVVLICLMAACGGDANRRVMAEVDTVGGVVLVRNGTGLWRKSEEWGVDAPTAMAWDGRDRLWVADGLRGRYHVFDSTGAFEKTVPRPVRAVKRRQHPLLWESAGVLVDETVTISGHRSTSLDSDYPGR